VKRRFSCLRIEFPSQNLGAGVGTESHSACDVGTYHHAPGKRKIEHELLHPARNSAGDKMCWNCAVSNGEGRAGTFRRSSMGEAREA